MPGPASTAYQSRDLGSILAVTDGCYFSPWQLKIWDPDHLNYFSAKSNNAIYWTHKKRSSSLSLHEKERTYKLVLWRHVLRQVDAWRHTYSTTQLNKLIPATFSGNSLRINQRWIKVLTSWRRPRRYGGPAGRNEENRTGSWTWDTPWNRGCPG